MPILQEFWDQTNGSEDRHSRYIEAAVGGLILGCLYLPNGNPALGPNFDYKLRLFERLTGYSQSLLDSGAPLRPCAEPEDAMGRATRKSGNFVAASNRWSCRDAPAERLEQIPRRPGPK